MKLSFLLFNYKFLKGGNCFRHIFFQKDLIIPAVGGELSLSLFSYLIQWKITNLNHLQHDLLR